MLVLATGLALAFAIRVHRLDFPFERDEGEYAYAGRLILEGVPPYTEVANMKLPGTYYAYALLMALFGGTDTGVHLGLAFWTTASALLVFAIGKRLHGRLSGALAGATFALLAASPGVYGLAGHATHFVLLPALAGIWLLLGAGPVRAGRALAAGLLFGLAFLMKQQAAAFVAFGAGQAILAVRRDGSRRIASVGAAFAVGAAAPYAALCLYLAAIGAFPDFWFWTVTYAGRYVSMQSIPFAMKAFSTTVPRVVGWNALVWALAAAGAVLAMRDASRRKAGALLVALAVLSFAAVLPGLYFRSHYFIVMLPAVALLAASGSAGESAAPSEARRRRAWAGLVVAALAVGIAGQAGALFTWSDVHLARAIYFVNPFVESREVARAIARTASPGDKVAVLGSEPEIPFYANMRSATRCPYVYALVEIHPFAARLQEETIREIEGARPEHLVLVDVGTSWLVRPNSERRILRWIDAWVPEHYDIVGLVEIFPNRRAEYTWGPEAGRRKSRTEDYLLVFRRKREPGSVPPRRADR